MKEYIDKAALVAEIKKRQKEHDEKKYDYASSDHFWASVEDGKILSFIDTLEVKEVDLKKPFEGIKVQTSMESGSLDEIIVTTKYKAQKGE